MINRLRLEQYTNVIVHCLCFFLKSGVNFPSSLAAAATGIRQSSAYLMPVGEDNSMLSLAIGPAIRVIAGILCILAGLKYWKLPGTTSENQRKGYGS